MTDVPHYDLDEVKELATQQLADSSSDVVYIRSAALKTSLDCFEWGATEILEAIIALEEKHFYKRDVCKFDKTMVFDFYKAPGLCGEDVYTHFYIDDDAGVLRIDSFKKI